MRVLSLPSVAAHGADAGKSAPPSRLSPLLRPECISLGVPLPDAAALFAHVATKVPLRERGAAAMVAQRLARRHARCSTAVGGGIALPHAEITHLPAPLVVFVRPAQPLPFGAADGHPVRDVLALLVRKPASSRDHALLTDLTHWLQHAELRAALAASSTPAAVLHVLSYWPWL